MSSAPTVAQITPTVGEVAQHILYRTREDGGALARTFTPLTEPTDVEAAAFALDAAEYVALKLGTVHTTWDGDMVDAAKRVVARFAALYIENSLTDGNDPDDKTPDRLGQMARERLTALLETARDNQPGSRPYTTVRLIGEAAGTPPAFTDSPMWRSRPLRLRRRIRRV